MDDYVRPYIDPDDIDAAVCGICPSKRLPREGFVIYDRPNREAPFDTADGFRYATGPEGRRVPACVHPHKIGLDPDRTAPPAEPEPLPATPEPEARGSRWRLFARGR
ncbi:hypothetical protein [Streptomyces sp. NPDC058045]|uniref:hypothetical protein n=1 Tax=Streptomyces sp. NPDC058045 TaxID=3346311 RepID=UPI0036DFD1A7